MTHSIYSISYIDTCKSKNNGELNFVSINLSGSPARCNARLRTAA